MSSEQQYIDLYQGYRDTIMRLSPEPMNAVREASFDAFRRQGLPTRKAERYKYSDMRALFAPDCGVNLRRLQPSTDPLAAFRCSLPNLQSSLFSVVNDTFCGALQGVRSRLPEGMYVGTLSDYCRLRPDFASKHYAKIASCDADAVTALNTMLAQDALVVHVERGVRAEHAVQIINLLRSDAPTMVNRRVLIVLDEGAEATLFVCDHCDDGPLFLTTQVTEVYVGAGAALRLYCMEETHARNRRVNNVVVEQHKDSRFAHASLTLHNGTTRNALEIRLTEEGAECRIDGIAIADKHQHVDNNTLIEHIAPHCTSRELYKYVLDEHATGAFAGRVLVHAGAHHTVSEENNHNLCATKEARMYSQPMLEIYADDVKCSHGSAVGQLSEDALFYMRQRGISLAEARMLLQYAFVNEVVEQITLAPLRERLSYLVDKRFRGELHTCHGCPHCS